MSRSRATSSEASYPEAAAASHSPDVPAHIPRKRFGQNFLHDPVVIERIIACVNPKPGEHIVEIGPGQGAITTPLLARCGRLVVIEIDRDLAARLAERFPPIQVTILQQDVLTIDFPALAASLGGELRIVGNLPYNISTPILFQLLESAHVIRDQHVMLQKEVVDRMLAPEGSRLYGRLSVMLQARYRMARCLKVPPGAFRPAPKVDSAVVRMEPIASDAVGIHDWHVFSSLVLAAFAQRRKMLRNALSAYAHEIDWESLNIAPTQRAEELSVETFIRLANAMAHCRPVADDSTSGIAQ
jgi:16S rRNA (adenine1518-N6/adenine1519-N6)-dimethyltransferase